ncbi:hypothetical protein [Bifidobacterium callitrichos]|uniref:Uncharacterized protein n=1 Tax=Bifidobacterium callitrichos DSM 23973 TaxID=1437609 RepID=A0A087ACQ2_9BIFI|nr:hypothetical protein [Bifidobacterium callitrichos]KFI56552.1 hypothetical protein BCAL_0147 [Bifidobacterium callitrichos DSM 23973]
MKQVTSIRYGAEPLVVMPEGDGRYSLRFDTADEAVVITGLNKTALIRNKSRLTEALGRIERGKAS